MAGWEYDTGVNDGVFTIIFGTGDEVVNPKPKGTQAAESIDDLVEVVETRIEKNPYMAFYEMFGVTIGAGIFAEVGISIATTASNTFRIWAGHTVNVGQRATNGVNTIETLGVGAALEEQRAALQILEAAVRTGDTALVEEMLATGLWDRGVPPDVIAQAREILGYEAVNGVDEHPSTAGLPSEVRPKNESGNGGSSPSSSSNNNSSSSSNNNSNDDDDDDVLDSGNAGSGTQAGGTGTGGGTTVVTDPRVNIPVPSNNGGNGGTTVVTDPRVNIPVPGNNGGNNVIPGGNEHDEGRRPIILDLDGDGVEVSLPAFVQFDMDDDGFLERTQGWAGPDDGFLVIDLNADGSRGKGDGKIDQTKELVLSEWGNKGDTDLQALARAFDVGKHKDGVLDSKDAIWDELKIWRDIDQDGVSDPGEVKSLADWKIKSIKLTYDDGSGYGKTSDDIDVGVAVLHGLASYTTTDGKTVKGGVGDMSLTYNTLGWKKVTTSAGFDIIFEQGRHLRYFDVTGKSSADVNLDGQVLDGAQGDDRANSLIATGHSRAVQISGGGGNDTIRGSDADYV